LSTVSSDAIPTAKDVRPDRLVEVSGLTVHFPITEGAIRRKQVGAVRAVDGIDIVLRRGETLGLVGESGSGKSTTGRAILRLVPLTSGTIKFDGQELETLGRKPMRQMRRRMQMIFQDPYASLNPRMKVSEIVGEPLAIHGIARGRDRRERVRQALVRVGLDPSFAERYPHEFSGGQLQRIGVARALTLDPELIVADEPVSALDVSIQAQLINLLEKLQTEMGLTYLFIAHDLAVVRHIADRVAVMYLGKIVEEADRDDLYERPLHPYTQALLSAVPIPDPEAERQRQRIILTGDIASPSNPPSGCRFRTRCFLREQLGDPEICSSTEPQLVEHLPGHRAACHFVEPTDPASDTAGASTA
jgi:oligopeptide transport system ATP-binding protein